ncbi:hypothetical protein BHM03_00046863 [Ensete ventricosum]|uniref:Uncharacterized protein n=1 Tax=Ensete ventricosum TaxID=4639 RepID=A0A445ML09_ENSVE|nr:hypothetical protein BHM03_00046863 [Ensete ventricosum]
MEAITSISTEPLLPSRASYVCNLSRNDDKLRSFQSYFRWMCIIQFDSKHAMVS